MGSLTWYLLLAGLLGFYLPWRLGFEFLDAAVLLPYACLSSLFATRAYGPEPARRLLDPPAAPADRRKVVAAAAAGWGAALLILAAGLLTVNVASWHGRPLVPPLGVLLSVVGLSLPVALVSVAAAARGARLPVLPALLVYFLGTRLLPGE